MKTPSYLLVPALAGAFALVAGCSSSSSGSANPSDSGAGGDGSQVDSSTPTDSGGDVIINTSNCVAPGTASNNQGIGGYCTPMGGQCTSAGPDGSATLCSADFTGTPGNAWFCTYPCNSVFDCGAGASCITEASSGQSGCVPTSCAFLAGDGGSSTEGGSGEAGMTGDSSTD